MRKFLVAIGAVLAMTVFSADAWARDYKLGDLTIQQPWARASIGAAKAGAAYLIVTNTGGEADRLIGVASPAAKRAEIHAQLIEAGVSKMRRVEAVEVAPGEPAVLRPGGLHIMLMGLNAPLIEGELLPLSLTFERAGTVEVEADIGAATANPDGSHKQHGREGES